jgi:hypothetical protein
VATYCEASALAREISWMTSPGTRREKRQASFASAHCRRDHVSPSVSRCWSVVSGKLSSTAKASLFAKRSSLTCADGSQPAMTSSNG